MTEEVSLIAVPAKRAKASASDAEKPIPAAQPGEKQGGSDIKKKNYRDGLGDFLIICLDDRCGGGDGRPAADGGTCADQCGCAGRKSQELFAAGACCRQRCEDGGGDDGKGLFSCFQDCAQVQAETEKDYSVTEHFPGGKGNPGLQGGSVPEQQRDAPCPGEVRKPGPPIRGTWRPMQAAAMAIIRQSRNPAAQGFLD